MSKEENSVETQGVKTYKVNEYGIKAMDWACYCDLCRLLDFDPSDMTIDANQIEGFTDGGKDYIVLFDEDQITVEIDGTDYWYDQDSDAFALAITYGIYEEA